MTEAARELLTVFDGLPRADQEEVTAEILRRADPSDGLPEDALHELADELFRSYDAEEELSPLPQRGSCGGWDA